MNDQAVYISGIRDNQLAGCRAGGHRKDTAREPFGNKTSGAVSPAAGFTAAGWCRSRFGSILVTSSQNSSAGRYCGQPRPWKGLQHPPDAIIIGTTTGGILTTEELLKNGDQKKEHYQHHGLHTVASPSRQRMQLHRSGCGCFHGLFFRCCCHGHGLENASQRWGKNGSCRWGGLTLPSDLFWFSFPATCRPSRL